MTLIELTYESIDVAKLLQAVSHPDAGGEVLFLGTTRQFTAHPESLEAESSLGEGQKSSGIYTEFLSYKAFEAMAISQMKRLADEAQQRWPLKGVAMVHRLGKVLPQEASIAIAVSSPHRAEAFEAARWLIDSVKQSVPIWKQENYRDASSQWVHPHSSPATLSDLQP